MRATVRRRDPVDMERSLEPPMARYTRARLPALPARGNEALFEGSALRRAEVPDHASGSRRKLSAGPARAAPNPAPSEFGLQLREKQKVRRYYGVLESQFRKHYVEAERRAASPATTCSRFWRSGSTTSSIAWDSPTRAGRPANSCGTATSPSTAARPISLRSSCGRATWFASGQRAAIASTSRITGGASRPSGRRIG